MAISVSTTATSHRATPRAPKSIAVLFAERTGVQAMIEEMERNGACQSANDDFQRLCATLFSLDARIMRVRPASIEDLRLQARVVAANIDLGGFSSPEVDFAKLLVAHVDGARW